MKTVPIGEYDRRVVLLTKERGKISAFAKGAKRPNSRLLAGTGPFSFGQFKLYAGRDSYSVVEADISNYFETLRKDYMAAYYGMYFLEIADYYTRENNDEVQMLKLLYQSLRALQHPGLQRELVRCVYEIKTIAVNGEYPGLPKNGTFQDSTRYALEFIVTTEIEKLFTFTVTAQVLDEMKVIAAQYRSYFMNYPFKSLEIIESLT